MSGDRPASLGPPAYRLSDGERDEAIAALADAFAEGRLDAGEFSERMQAASEATFATDLDPLFADLPTRQARSRAVTPVPGRRPQQFRRHPAPFPALVVGIGLLLLLVTLGPWILLPALVLLTKHRIHVGAAGWASGRPSGCYSHGGRQGYRSGTNPRARW